MKGARLRTCASSKLKLRFERGQNRNEVTLNVTTLDWCETLHCHLRNSVNPNFERMLQPVSYKLY